MLRKLSLNLILPNPYRDFSLYPIDREQVDRLLSSIKDLSFWGNLDIRPSPTQPGKYELVQGHHRLEALRALTDEHTFDVGNHSDEMMVKRLAVENSTQRGHCFASTLDTVASITRLLAKDLLSSVPGWENSQSDTDIGNRIKQRDMLLTGQGLGRGAIISFAPKDTLDEEEVKVAIATLKDSGKLVQIVKEVQAEIEAASPTKVPEPEEIKQAQRKFWAADQRQRKALAAVSKADSKTAKKQAEKKYAEAVELTKQERAKATELKVQARTASLTQTLEAKPRRLDERVAAVFHTPGQVAAFHRTVVNENISRLLPVEQQMPLAEAIKEQAKTQGSELTPQFIRNEIIHHLRQPQKAQQAADEEDETLRHRLAETQIRRLMNMTNTAQVRLSNLITKLVKEVEDGGRLPHNFDSFITGLETTFAADIARLRKQTGIKRGSNLIRGNGQQDELASPSLLIQQQETDYA